MGKLAHAKPAAVRVDLRRGVDDLSVGARATHRPQSVERLDGRQLSREGLGRRFEEGGTLGEYRLEGRAREEEA